MTSTKKLIPSFLGTMTQMSTLSIVTSRQKIEKSLNQNTS